MENITRRDLVIGAAAVSGAAVAGGIVASAKASESADVSAASDSGDGDWLGEAPEIADSDIAETVDCDVLVVGAGQSGSACASFAAAGGAKTLWIEANENGDMMRSSAISGINTSYQKEVGVEINPEDILNDVTHYALNQCNMKLWRDWVDHSAEVVEWYGGEVEKSGQRIALEYTMPPEGRYQTWPTGHGTATMDPLPDNPNDPSTSSGDEAAVWNVIEADFEANGGEYRNLTKLIELVKDGDKVTGAIAQKDDGTYLQINAAKGVVIATGGYVNNEEMFVARQGGLEKSLSGNLNWGTCHGDGIKACLWAGAHMDNFPTTMVFDRGVIKPDTENGQVFDQGDFQYTNFCSQPWLKVNCEGKRIMNESAPYDFIVHASMQQPDHSWYIIWDSSWREDVQEFKTIGCSTLYSREGSNHHAPGLDKVEETINDLVDGGYCIKADTVEELAEGLGIDAETFANTVETYNGYVADGYDAQYGKDPYRLSAVDEPPFYGMKVGGLPLCTLDGIVINDDYQAVDDEGKAIEGLYVIGNDSGCCYAHTYPNFGAGTNAGRCATAGMLVGKALASA
jgi:fumarate reductase flavoprotein subunit